MPGTRRHAFWWVTCCLTHRRNLTESLLRLNPVKPSRLIRFCTGNAMWSKKLQRLKLFDFQGVGRAPPACELAYFL